MKLAGQKLEKTNSVTIVIPRGNDKPVVFVAAAILDYSQFDVLCPRPTPPIKLKRGGERLIDAKDPKFIAAIGLYSNKRMGWMIMESLRLGTPELEWETVSYTDCNTWPNCEKELAASGFTFNEIQLILAGVMQANCLDDDKIQEAREAFFRSQEEDNDPLLSPTDERQNTPSGELASGLE